MTQKTITIRELHQRMSKIAERARKGQRFLVTKHMKPLFRIEPPDEKKQEKSYTLEDITKLQFKGGNTLSRDVDRLLYDA